MLMHRITTWRADGQTTTHATQHGETSCGPRGHRSNIPVACMHTETQTTTERETDTPDDLQDRGSHLSKSEKTVSLFGEVVNQKSLSRGCHLPKIPRGSEWDRGWTPPERYRTGGRNMHAYGSPTGEAYRPL